MSNYANVAAEAGDKYLETLAQGQDRLIEYVRASREFMPPIAEAHVPAMKFAPAMPFTVPTPQEVADVQFGFANKLLELQQKFYRRLYQSPTAGSAVKSAARSGGSGAAKAKTTKARTAKKTTSRPTPVK